MMVLILMLFTWRLGGVQFYETRFDEGHPPLDNATPPSRAAIRECRCHQTQLSILQGMTIRRIVRIQHVVILMNVMGVIIVTCDWVECDFMSQVNSQF